MSVVDRDGLPVRGLSAEDFTVTVDGQPRTLTSAQFVAYEATARDASVARSYSTNAGTANGRLIMLAVDSLHLKRATTATFLRAATRLLDGLGPHDKVGLTVLPGGPTVDFTSNLDLVRAALSRVPGGNEMTGMSRLQRVGLSEAVMLERGDAQLGQEVIGRECGSIREQSEMDTCVSQLRAEAQSLVMMTRNETRNTMTALHRLLARLQAIPQTKTLVLLTSGIAVESDLADVSWIGSVTAAARANIYAVVFDDAMGGVDASGMRAASDRRLRLSGMRTITGLARGAAVEVVAGPERAYERVVRELSGHYVLGFEPTDAERDGKSHEINIAVKRPGTTLHARREFVVAASTEARLTPDRLVARAIADPLVTAERVIDVVTHCLPDLSATQVRVLVSARVHRAQDATPAQAVAYRLTDSDGKQVAAGIEELQHVAGDAFQRYMVTATVPPGQYTLKLAVADADGRRGSIEHQVDAALTQAADILSGDVLLIDEAATKGDLRPVFGREVQGDSARVYFEFGSRHAPALNDVVARVEIVDSASGVALTQTAATVSQTRSANRRMAQAIVPVTELPAGDYAVRIILSARGGDIVQATTPITTAAAHGVSPEFLRYTVPVFAPTSARDGSLRALIGATARRSSADYESTPALRTAVEALERDRPEDVLAALRLPDVRPAVALLRGWALLAGGSLEPAARDLRAAISGGADAVAVGTALLGACYAAGRREDQAIGAWQTAVAIDDPVPAVAVWLVDAYTRQRRWDDVIATLQEMHEQDPAAVTDTLLVRKALAFAQTGRIPEALEILDRYITERPSDRQAAELGMRAMYVALAKPSATLDTTAWLERLNRFAAASRSGHDTNPALVDRWYHVIETRLRAK